MAPRTATAERPADAQRPTQQQQPAVQPGTGTSISERAKPPHPIVAFKSYMDERMGEVALSLPPHMTAERFGRVVLTALQRTPKLLACTKQSLFNACMLAAQDGLLPDGREGAIVPYADGKADQAQWMPMIEGLRKKARNSGEISNWEVHIVRARDQFEVVLGDSPRIDHKPYFGAEDPGEIIGAYSIAWLKDGTISRDVMTIRDIQKIKNISKAAKGPWSNPTFFPEMCKKTVARRHYKQLPHAAELDEFIKRLDEREGFADDADRIESRSQQRVASTAAAFDEFSKAPVIEHQPDVAEHEAGELSDPPVEETGLDEFNDDPPPQTQQQPTAQPEKAKPVAEQPQPKAEAQPDPKTDAEPQGDQARRPPGELLYEGEAETDAEPDKAAWPMLRLPTNPVEYLQFVRAFVAEMTDPSKIGLWFKSPDQRDLRNKCQVMKPDFDAAKDIATKAISDLQKPKA